MNSADATNDASFGQAPRALGLGLATKGRPPPYFARPSLTARSKCAFETGCTESR
ncbi:MAG: hypothetical protein RLZZ565_1236 [Planctomycetota bacterium]|jgi:hypothetical protein